MKILQQTRGARTIQSSVYHPIIVLQCRVLILSDRYNFLRPVSLLMDSE